MVLALAAAGLAGCGRSGEPASGGCAPAATGSGPAVLATEGEAEQGGAAADMQVFDDVQSMAEASDVVVEATVGKDFTTEPDDPEPDGPALPVRVGTLTILRVLAGDLRKGQLVDVVTSDTTGMAPEDFSVLDPGQHVVLFLSYLPQGSPGISGSHSFYVPKSGDYGTFDVCGTRATSRAAGFRGLLLGQPLSETPGRLQVTVEDLAAAVESVPKAASTTS